MFVRVSQKLVATEGLIVSLMRLFCLLFLFAIFPDISTAEDGWLAHVIAVKASAPENYVEDYATEQYSSAWDFDKGTLEGLGQSTGVYDLGVRSGRLSFKTSNNASLTWGDMNLDHPEFGEERIGEKWKKEVLPWVVRVKLRQSLNESKWFVEAGYREHTQKNILRKEVMLKGQQEQVLVFPMGRCYSGFFSFRLGTQTPGNEVSIDWIRIERPSAVRYFRKTVFLKDSVLNAKLSLGVNAHYRLFVNGELISNHGGQPPFDRRLNVVENITAFRPGKNVIAIEAEEFGSFNMSESGKMLNGSFFLQGAVVTRDGKIIPLRTDKSWKGSYTFNDGWEKDLYDDANWSNVIDRGSLEANQLDGYSRDGIGGFREPSYAGRIQVLPVGREFPFYAESEAISLPVKVLPAQSKLATNIVYAISKFGMQEKLRSGRLQLSQDSSPYASGVLNIKGLAAGVYNLSIAYEVGDGSVDKRDYEFVVAGKLLQPKTKGASYEDGMSLHLVDAVDFTKGEDKSPTFTYGGPARSGVLFFDRPTPRIIKRKGLAYLETGPRRDDWFSTSFKVKNLYRPHLAVVSYPDDDERNMVFMIGEPTSYNRLANVGFGGGLPRATPGVFTGGDLATSGKMKEFKFVFWPNEIRSTLTVVNSGRSHKDRGAASNVKIYEIEGDLPALDIVPTKAMIGPFVERIDRVTPMTFYAGDLKGKFPYALADGYQHGYYSAWYTTIENLIKYLRFTGQNTYFAGIYMYSGGWFPSASFQGWPESGNDYQGEGWKGGAIELMATMFAENNLNLVLGVQFIGSKKLFELDTVTDGEMVKGKVTNRFVTASGRQKKGFQGEGFNFLMPDVRAEMLALADEISSKYSSYASVKGVTWMRLPEFRAGEKTPDAQTGLDIGYDDATISLFTHETGISIPVAIGDKDRFQKRYRWLLQNQKEKWLSWRSSKVHEMDEQIYAHLTAHRQDWKVWHLVGRPDRNLLRLFRKGEMPLRDVYRYQGLDPLMYGKNNSPRLVPFHEMTGDRFYRDILNDQDARTNMLAANQATKPTGPFKAGGVFLHTGFLIETQLQSEDKYWPWQRIACVGYPAPGGDDFYREASSALNRPDLEIIPIGWSDVIQMVGHEQQLRSVVRMLGKVENNKGILH